MLAAIYQRKGKIKVMNIPRPEISDNEVLLKVKVSSICGTDRKIYQSGHRKIKEGTEQILGHEITGIIEEIGQNVKHYQKGMRIVLAPNVGCGHCQACHQGFEQLCSDYNAFGISWPGGFAEYVKIPEEAVRRGNMFEIPDELTYEEAAVIEPLACCYSTYEAMNIKPGDSLLIFGAGPMGILHLILNKHLGIGKTIIADIDESRLAISKDFGADYTIISNSNLRDTIMEITNGKGVNAIITAASVPSIQEQALDLIALNGNISFFAGLPALQEQIRFNSNIVHYKQLRITGTTGASLEQFRRTVKLVEDKSLNLKKIVTKRIALQELETIFNNREVFSNNIKIVVTFK